MAVAGEVEQDSLRLALFAAAYGLVDGAAHSVVRFRRRHNALTARELHPRLEARHLVVGTRLDQAELTEMRHDRRHAVVAQSTGVEPGRDEGGAQRVHLDERREMRGVAEVVSVLATRQGRAGGGLDRHDAPPATAAQA